MKKVLITPRSFGKVSAIAENILTTAGFELVKNPKGSILDEDEMKQYVRDVSAIIVGVDPITASVIDSAPYLKVISKYGTGLDNIDVGYAKSKGIKIFTTSDAPVEAVADFTFALLLSVARKIVEIDRSSRSLDWSKNIGLGIYRKTIGILGTGRVGKAVAKRAKGFDMKILASDVATDTILEQELGVQYVTATELFSQSDFICVHLPYNSSTKGMISKTEISMMKETVIIVNTARGGIINENDLYDALKVKRIWGAGIDVFENEPPHGSPLLKLDNIILGTHCASSTYDAINNMSLFSAKNVIDAFSDMSAV